MKVIHVRAAKNHMATTFTLTLACEETRVTAAHEVLRECHARIASCELTLSEFLESSPIYRLNHSPSLERVRLPAQALGLMERSMFLWEKTHGAFDPTHKSAPSAHPRIAWCRESETAWKLTDGARVGFGAIGKGFALDEAREILEREGFTSYLLNAGGSSLILNGFSSPGEPWSWGWSWRNDEEGEPLGLMFEHAGGTPVSIGVSGLHEKGRHILTPGGEKAVGAQSALVAASSAADADALSTALFVSGWENGLKDLGTVSEVGAAMIDNGDVPRWNGIFQKFWGAIVCLLFLLPTFALAEDAVDLGAMGLEDFTPYAVERNNWWALLPIVSLLLVFAHLKKARKPRIQKPLETK